MARLGFFIGLILPVLLLGVNLVLGYGGILATVALFVWIGLGVLLSPASEEEG
ncbi:MAG TPA: hypothetical protein VEO20_01840 [Thermoplasmata archaeon]|nr:hypothetical protein [Thermoplasmata archaeon]